MKGRPAPLMRLVKLLVVLLAAGLPACGGAPELQVLTWSDYLAPEVKRRFEEETGARVVESVFASNEELYAKLAAGASGYDLVCPSDYMVARLARDGLLEELDAARLPGLEHLAERFARPPYDPEHRWSVPFQWGVTGIGYDARAVDPPPTGWEDLFDPARAGRFAGRISMLEDVRETIGAALIHLGHSPNSRDPAALAAAEELLLAQKPLVASYTSESYADDLAGGSLALAHGWNGAFALARIDAPHVGFVVPEEGTLVYVDNWAVPRGAPNRELAHRFVAFLLRPEIAALNVNELRYPSCNAAAREHVEPAILAGLSYVDGSAADVELHWLEDVGPTAEVHERIWRRLKGE